MPDAVRPLSDSVLQSAPRDAPWRAIAFARPDVVQEQVADGVILRAATPLADYDPSLAAMFRAAAARAPDRVFLAEREGENWRTVTYASARATVDGLATALLGRGLSPVRPVMILSANAVDHALLMLAGFCAGVPVAPISVAYSLQSNDHGKLKHIAALLTPGLVYVADTAPFMKALAALDLGNAEIVASRNGAGLPNVTRFDDLAATRPGGALDAAVAGIAPDTIAKILFTSGSTGLPKGVINTHGMLAANQQMIHHTWPFLDEAPPVLVDWLPWNHTFGGNYNFNLVMRHAGTLYIDNGRPVPSLVGETVRNLSEISPTIYFNVPAGYAALLPALENDPAFARTFFARLRLIFYAGAALPQDLWARLETVALRITGERIPMTSAWGSTETSPLATSAHFRLDQAGVIGVPVPGVELKLVPVGAKTEVRVRGPSVTPGYWKRPDLTAEAFDADGFYKIGDAVRFADPADASKGVVFDGRLAEDFKLTSGTWVHVGGLRIGALAAATPAVQDAIVCGENRDAVGLLIWLNVAGCRSLIGDAAPAGPAELAKHDKVRTHIAACIARWNASQSGGSQRIARVLLLPDAPSVDANEITDKGYINQRLALERRSAEIALLYAEPAHAEVIVL
jgi:feruloyl-CoA synthase